MYISIYFQVKSIECELCGKKFPQLQNLKKHISGKLLLSVKKV